MMKPVYETDENGNVKYNIVNGEKVPIFTGEYIAEKMNKTVNILGTEYLILFGKEEEYPALETRDGYCDSSIKYKR